MSKSSLAGYARATWDDIRRNGWQAVARKCRSLFWWSLALALYPLVALLRPIVRLRIMRVPANYLGHLCLRPDIYLSERKLGLQPRRTFDVFHLWPLPPSNAAVVRVLSRSLRIWQGSYYFYQLYNRLPGGRAHIFHPRIRDYEDMDSGGVMHRAGRNVSLSAEEQSAGWKILDEQGISDSGQFICFHARSSAYYPQRLIAGDPAGLEQQQAYRNCDVETYLPAVRSLAERGFTAFRMGAVRERPIPDLHPRIVDYANSFRSEFMDVFLLANCRFLVGSASGVDAVAELFRRPMLTVNMALFAGVHSWMPNLTIFKKYRLVEEQRFLKFREIVEMDAHYLQASEDYERLGIEFVDNTAEEISDAVDELEARLDGRWQERSEDKELQARFWAVLQDHPLHQNRCGLIGATYLRQHQDLLD